MSNVKARHLSLIPFAIQLNVCGIIPFGFCVCALNRIDRKKSFVWIYIGIHFSHFFFFSVTWMLSLPMPLFIDISNGFTGFTSQNKTQWLEDIIKTQFLLQTTVRFCIVVGRLFVCCCCWLCFVLPFSWFLYFLYTLFHLKFSLHFASCTRQNITVCNCRSKTIVRMYGIRNT